MRKQLLIFQTTEVIPQILLSLQQGNKQVLYSLIEAFKTSLEGPEGPKFLSSFKNLLSHILEAKESLDSLAEPLLSTDDFKQIYKMVLEESCL